MDIAAWTELVNLCTLSGYGSLGSVKFIIGMHVPRTEFTKYSRRLYHAPQIQELLIAMLVDESIRIGLNLAQCSRLYSFVFHFDIGSTKADNRILTLGEDLGAIYSKYHREERRAKFPPSLSLKPQYSLTPCLDNIWNINF